MKNEKRKPLPSPSSFTPIKILKQKIKNCKKEQ